MDTNKKWVFLFLIAAVLIAVLSSLSGVQKKISPLLDNQNRKVLAKINSFYGVEQNQFLILKVKDGEGIRIEIFEIDKNTAAQTFRQKFDLFQDSDAYVTIDKNSTNLALSDVDKDGQMDILAPTVDRNGNLRLNTFRFNTDLKMFEPYLESNK
jgi:6-phosphogluconolactonase (cycloisomerase 2 family)